MNTDHDTRFPLTHWCTGCHCPGGLGGRPSRRLFSAVLLAGGAAAAWPALAREGVEVGPQSGFSNF